MPKTEGVIQFRLDFVSAPPRHREEVAELAAWRQVLFRLGLLGRDPARYDGLGYGNLSCRLPPFDAPPDERRFLISGTQTGGLAELGPEHFALVTACRPEENAVVAEGPLRPSSEALSHAALYRLDPGLRWVVHGHSPLIWSRADRLGLAVTDPGVGYGTPQMASEVARLWTAELASSRRVLAMGGHLDGVLAWGGTAAEAAEALVKVLAEAMRREFLEG